MLVPKIGNHNNGIASCGGKNSVSKAIAVVGKPMPKKPLIAPAIRNIAKKPKRISGSSEENRGSAFQSQTSRV